MATISGQKVVTTHGTAVQLGTIAVNGPVMVKALASNADLVFVGNVGGDVTSATGMELDAGEVLLFNQVGHLETIWVDSAADGDGVAWLALDI